MRSLFGMFKREAIPNGGWRTCQCVVPGLTRSLLSRKEGKKEREKRRDIDNDAASDAYAAHTRIRAYCTTFANQLHIDTKQRHSKPP